MDADRNGIPCETVFPRSDVAAYWGVQTPQTSYGGMAGGLFCVDLYMAGVSYAEAVGYWYSQGSPARMDADGNGIPCETVYPSAVISAYWFP
ncbi:MAG: serine/threonine protein kinase [Acidimicrobiales bacterium]|nr:serine/threonine protein kinase [Acidimicrobiales bacterium]